MSKHSIPQQIADTLSQLGITHIFGIPGTHNIELYDAFRIHPGITPILITDEQSSGFIADGYHRSSGKMAALSLVPGAGLTHALSGITEAYLDQIPLLVLACGIRKDSGKSFQLHDVDQISIVTPVTKAALTLTDWGKVKETLTQAVQLAQTVPAGPVVIEIPAEGLLTSALESQAQSPISIPTPPEIKNNAIQESLQLIQKAKKIGLYIGNLQDPASPMPNSQKLVAFADLLNAQVWTTITAKGIFPENHDRFVWNVPGVGSPSEMQKLSDSIDLWIALGSRFGEVATASYGFEPKGDLIHIDLDSKSLGANLKETLSIHGDAWQFIEKVTKELTSISSLISTSTPLSKVKRPVPQGISASKDTTIYPHELLSTLQKVFPQETIYSFDSGNGLFQAVENLTLSLPRKFLAPVDYSCMGYSVPAAIGAQFANPQTPVIALPGDGAFLMTGLEILSTHGFEHSPLIFLLRDGELSQIAQFQRKSMVHTVATSLHPYQAQFIAQATGAEFLQLSPGHTLIKQVQKAYDFWKEGKRVLVEVPINYSISTAFTEGVLKTNFKRFPFKEKIQLAGRLVTRKIGLDL